MVSQWSAFSMSKARGCMVDAVEATYQSVLFSNNVTDFVGNFTCEISNVRVADPVRDSDVTCRVGICACVWDVRSLRWSAFFNENLGYWTMTSL